MFRTLASSAAIALLAGAAGAQTTSVDVRIVERTGQSQVLFSSGGASPDAALDLAVQIRVNGGSGLSGFGFNAVILAEPDTSGTLALGLISNADHTYAGLPPALSAAVGRGGLASTYSYLATINSSFNGKINVSSGQFTHNPANTEIGLVAGTAIGSALFGTPGLDPSSLSAPSTWPGYGSATPPAVGTTATIGATVGSTYLAQGQFVDVYRFRYTVSNFTARTLNFTLQNLTLQTAPRFIYGNTTGWGLDQATWSGTVNQTDLSIPLVLAPQGQCCNNTTGTCTLAAQFDCTSPSSWTSGASCLPNPCIQPGSCCDTSGLCSSVVQTSCGQGSAWTQGAACQPNPCPQPGACCTTAGACSLVLQTACTGGATWSAGTCQPNPCAQPGTCCDSAGACSLVLQTACASGSTWTVGGACQPNPCPQPGACCDTAGACSLILQTACTGSSAWSAGTCQPNPCPQPGACCDTTGACSFILQSACASGSVWSVAAACLPNPCPQPGTCCAAAGTCTMTLQTACASDSTWTLGGACQPNPCPQNGACCRGSTCQFVAIDACTGQFDRYAGTGVACNASGNITTPCCKADFNGGGLAVQDIFDFLNAWFATSPMADFNGDGLAVQDIFDFLNAWLAGC